MTVVSTRMDPGNPGILLCPVVHPVFILYSGAARPIRPVRPWPDHFSRWSGRIYIWPDHFLVESIDKFMS